MAQLSLTEYRKALGTRMRNLKKLSRREPLNAAKFMVLKAKQLAPRRSGDLIQGIKRRKIKNGYQVSSKALSRNTGFPYNKWVNRDVQIMHRGKVRSTYGSTPAGWNWTAKGQAKTKGYFDYAIKLTSNEYSKNVLKKIKTIMKEA